DTKLDSAETVDGKPAYVIQIGDNIKWFYDQETGLKILDQRKFEGQGQEIYINSYYKDYKEFENILLPYTILTEISGQEMEAKVEEYIINGDIKEGQFD